MEAVRAAFRPEFLNRLDEILLFRRLSRDDMNGIVEIQLGGCKQLLADRKIVLDDRRRGGGLAGRDGLRPGLRRPAAEARDPARTAEPAGAADPRRPHLRRRHGADHRQPVGARHRRSGTGDGGAVIGLEGKKSVIPGRPEGPNPEPIFQSRVFMGSGFAA